MGLHTHTRDRASAGAFEKATLARLPNDECRTLFLRDRLRWKQAFPDKPEPRKHQLRYPDPAEGEHEVITVYLTATQREMLDRVCKFNHVTRGYVMAKYFATLERNLLRRLDDDDRRRRYLAGEIKRPRRPGPVGEPIALEDINTE